jgi:hypothetical protein
MKKKLTVFCFCLAALMLIAGCGSRAPASETPAETAAAETGEAPAETSGPTAEPTPEPTPEPAPDEPQTESFSLEEGTPFRWREYGGTIVKTDTGGISTGMFVLKPADMKDDEYCFDLYLEVDDELLDNEELAKAFYEAAVLTDEQGNRYPPRVSTRPSEGADYLFLYAVPNSVPENELRLAPAE